MEDEARGFRSLADRYVCSACAGEAALSAFVEENADAGRCDYCGAASTAEPVAIHLDQFMEHIIESLGFEYTDPINELPIEASEGGYQGETSDTADVLGTEGCEFEPELLDDVLEAMGDRLWCRRDYFGLPRDQALMAGWESFCQQVTHATRYFFLSPTRDGGSVSDPDVPGPAEMLTALGTVITDADRVRSYPGGTRWFRARPHPPYHIPTGAAQLGPPPRDKAAANRMSAAGIPMFYGTQEIDTAIAEVMAVPSNARYPLATVGTFVSARPSLLLDLTSLPEVPSLFDASSRHLRAPLRFLRAFVDDLSRPVSLDDMEHLEYVPTQVVTEWFRHVFLADEGLHPDGVVYPSARKPGSVCCVLFVDADACCDETPGWDEDPAKSLALTNAVTTVVHPGYANFLASADLKALRDAGLKALGRQSLLTPEEWAEFALHGERTPEYAAFCVTCRAVGATHGLAEWIVRGAALQSDYHPELGPFPIEADYPQATVVVNSDGDPLFQRWLLYTAWTINLRVVVHQRGGMEIVPISIPFPARPDEPLTDAHRPPISEAFSWRVEIPASYTSAAAGSVAREEQEYVRELIRRLGYDLEHSPVARENQAVER